jgi:glycosyltransferase involved in cell wall biosynthesis
MLPAESTPPRISVVMCTRNRPDTIEQAVISVLANDYPTFDLTVVDLSTTAATKDILRPVADVDRRLQYIHVEEPGLSRAYNTGIGRTKGELLAFTDDDCVVPKDWLNKIVRAFGEDTGADLLYGQVIAPESDGTPWCVVWGPISRPAEVCSRRSADSTRC